MKKAAFQKQLISWFRRNKRDLPWRRSKSPYKTWVSEMMLQQTQVRTVVPYFNRWMRKLPSIKSLDKASEDFVLSLWQGLGYYSRARQLKKAASYMIRHHKGRLPQSYDEIIKVPGIGPYSAGAILSLAFNQKVPIVDGNVLRVLSRILAFREPINLPRTRDAIRDLEASLLPNTCPGDFNEALMELGALICTPREPQCGQCPVRNHCRAFKQNLTDFFPIKTSKKPIQKVQACALILEHGNRYLIQRRPEGRVMGGLWEFPEWKVPQTKRYSLNDQITLISKNIQTNEKNLSFITKIKRHYTHFSETLCVFRTNSKLGSLPHPTWPARWLAADDLESYPLTSAHSKIRSLILTSKSMA